jgi:hypothetical protein
LNLRYTDPADPSEGGRWFLLAKTDSTFGLAGVSVRLNNVNTAGIALGNPTAVGTGTAAYATMASTVTNSIANGGNPYAGMIGTSVNVVWGQDVGTSVVANIGKGAGTAGNLTADPLRNATWANSALLVSGTFGATRPTFAAGTEANVLGAATAGTAAIAATSVTTTVRGDSLNTLGLESPAGAGLLRGDLNRNGVVSLNGDALVSYNNIGQFAGVATWDQGDFNDTGTISLNGDALPAYNNIGVAAPPAPAVGAVPEPATIGLCAIAACGMLAAGRRKS